ncbi:MAG: helix-hairpin-helix domain-containing protein, partial [Anaerolineales bacterium]
GVLEQEEELVSAEPEEVEPITEEVEAEPAILEQEEELVSVEPGVLETKPEVSVETAIDVNIASLAQLEQIPGVGFIVAQSIIDYREKHGTIEDLDELADIPDIDKPILEEIRPWLFIETLKEEPVEEISKEPELLDAWHAIESGKIEVAVRQYQQLIKDHRYLDDIILDLTNATQLYPDEVPIFVALGDAYFHNDELQEALDVYLQAEELLK